MTPCRLFDSRCFNRVLVALEWRKITKKKIGERRRNFNICFCSGVGLLDVCAGGAIVLLLLLLLLLPCLCFLFSLPTTMSAASLCFSLLLAVCLLVCLCVILSQLNQC